MSNISNMSNIGSLDKELDLLILDTLMKKEISFIVMNKNTAREIVTELNLGNPYYFTLTSYKGYNVLISESLDYGEFRIG